MALDLLKRELAPVLPAAFAAVDTEAARVLKLNLAGRRIVDFKGPHGWELAAVNTGRLQMISGGGRAEGPRRHPPGAAAGRGARPDPAADHGARFDRARRGRSRSASGGRGRGAGRRLRGRRDLQRAVAPAGIVGIIPASPHAPHQLPADVDAAAAHRSWRRARRCGRRGSAARTRWCSTPRYTAQVLAAAEDGYPLAKRITAAGARRTARARAAPSRGACCCRCAAATTS